MGVPGYRGTSPPKLFISHDRKEIESLESIGGYLDPFDLKNTFVSFEIDFDKTGGAVAELVIINPKSDLEKKLFSWYAAIAPKSWKAEQVPEGEVLTALASMESFWIRWGYVSDPEEGGTLSTQNEERFALSHMHKFILLDMDYRISDKEERLVTLHFLTKWDITYRSPVFHENPKTFKVDLFNRRGRLRKPSRVIEEALQKMMGGVEGYDGLSNFSPDQRALINIDWLTHLEAVVGDPDNKVSPTVLQENLPDRDSLINALKTFDYAKLYTFPNTPSGRRRVGTPGGPVLGPPLTPEQIAEGRTPAAWGGWRSSLIALDTLKSFYRGFGLDSFISELPEKPKEKKRKKPSLDQDGGRNSITSQNANQPYVEAEGIAAAADTLVTPEFVVGGQLTIIGDQLLIDNNPMQPGSGTFIWLIPGTRYKLFAKQRYVGQPFNRLLNGYDSDLKEILDSGRFCMATEPGLSIITAHPVWGLSLDPGIYYAQPPDWIPEESEIPFYDLSSAPILEYRIKQYLKTVAAKKQEVNQTDGISDTLTPESEAVLEEFAQGPGLSLPEPPPEPEESMYVQITCPPNTLMQTIQGLLTTLNNKYFKTLGVYVQAERIEFANIPERFRPDVDAAIKKYLPGIKLDWEGGTGLVVVGPQAFFEELFAWKDEIVSFPGLHMDPDNLNTVSLSVGHQTRKDNIISDLQWKMDKGSMFLNIRRSPVLMKRLYSVKERFENSEYVDAVSRVLTQSIYGNSKVDKVEYTRMFGKLDVGDQQIGDLIFSDKMIQGAITYTGETNEGHSKALKDKILRKRINEDLRFILNNDFVEIFFPGITNTDYSKVDVRGYITPDEDRGFITFDADKAEEPGHPAWKAGMHFSEDVDVIDSIAFFRYLSSDPITVLRRKLAYLDVLPEGASEDEVALLASKMAVLSIFQKIITNVQITTLGIPEMDIFANEVMNRNIALWVHEQRVPGTYHWITGMYNIMGLMHRIDSSGYETKFTLVRKLPDEGDEMRKLYTLTTGGVS